MQNIHPSMRKTMTRGVDRVLAVTTVEMISISTRKPEAGGGEQLAITRSARSAVGRYPHSFKASR